VAFMNLGLNESELADHLSSALANQ
jgi:hypothetical protein